MAVAFITSYSPATNPNSTNSSAISVSVTVGVGDTIVLAIGGGSPATVTTAPAGGGLTYTQQVANNPGGSISSLYMYTATSASVQTFTLTATMSLSDKYGTTVSRFSGVGSIGANNKASNATASLPSMSLTTTTDNSVAAVSVSDFNSVTGSSTWVTTSGTPTIVEDDVLVGGVADHNAYYTVGAAGAKTLGMSAPTGQAWCIGAVELIASTTAGIQPPRFNQVARRTAASNW